MVGGTFVLGIIVGLVSVISSSALFFLIYLAYTKAQAMKLRSNQAKQVLDKMQGLPRKQQKPTDEELGFRPDKAQE